MSFLYAYSLLPVLSVALLAVLHRRCAAGQTRVRARDVLPLDRALVRHAAR